MFSTLFKEPKVLTYEEDLTIAPAASYAFAKELYYVPLIQTEIARAACCYPVLFVKTEDGIFPMALLSLKENVNLFVNEKGEWEKECHIPAFVKTYPFAVTSPKWNESVRVLFDTAYEGVGKEGIEIIKEKKVTEKGQKILDNIQNHYAAFEETMKMMGELEKMGLFKETEVTLLTEDEDQNRLLKDIYQIDVEKLDTLSDKKLLLLVKSGMMAMVYFHLSSLGYAEKLKNRL